MRFRVFVTSKNRPVLLRRLLYDIARAAVGREVSVTIYDDASDACMESPMGVARALGYDWVRASRPHGKKSWRQFMNRMYRSVQGDPAQFFVVMPDDVRLCDDFFTRAVKAWVSITDPKKIALNLLRDTRDGKTERDRP